MHFAGTTHFGKDAPGGVFQPEEPGGGVGKFSRAITMENLRETRGRRKSGAQWIGSRRERLTACRTPSGKLLSAHTHAGRASRTAHTRATHARYPVSLSIRRPLVALLVDAARHSAVLLYLELRYSDRRAARSCKGPKRRGGDQERRSEASAAAGRGRPEWVPTTVCRLSAGGSGISGRERYKRHRCVSVRCGARGSGHS